MGLSALSVKWVTVDGTGVLLFLHLFLKGNKLSLLDTRNNGIGGKKEKFRLRKREFSIADTPCHRRLFLMCEVTQ